MVARIEDASSMINPQPESEIQPGSGSEEVSTDRFQP